MTESTVKLHKTNLKKPHDHLLENGWQPITTAPKDGSFILLRKPKKDGYDVRTGKFFRYGLNNVWRLRINQTWKIDAVTHWKPLPEPPKESNNETP